MHFHHLAMRLCLLALSLGAALPCFAATPGDQDLIRDRQDRLLQEQQRRLEELRDLPGQPATPPTAPAAPDTRCFPIDTIEIKGADQLSQADRDSLGRGLVTSRPYTEVAGKSAHVILANPYGIACATAPRAISTAWLTSPLT